VALWVIGVIGAALLVTSPWLLTPSQHVIDCGVDQNGRPYAKVLVMNLLGRYHNSNWTGVHFSYEGLDPDPYASVGFERPAHSITITVVHSDRVPKGDVSGRAVSCTAWKDY
jgi:hypothetical protein